MEPFSQDLPVLRLENPEVWVEADARFGGSLSGLGLSQEASLVNRHDPGRLVQATLYDARFYYPHFDPGADIWPWNPVPGGDRRGIVSGAESWWEDSRAFGMESLPREWSGSGVSDVVHGVEVSLEGPAVRYRWEFQNLSDEWREGRDQELPAVYTVRGLNRIVGYVGRRPWDGEGVVELELVEGDHVFTEGWAALVDAQGNGLTVWSPRGDGRFRTFVQGQGSSLDPTANATGYITPLGLADLPPRGVQKGEVYLIPGHWTRARAWIDSHRRELATAFSADSGQWRQWAFAGLLPPADDGAAQGAATGLVLGDAPPRLRFHGRDAWVYPPPTGWATQAGDSLMVTAAFHGDSVPVSVRYWRHDGTDWYGGCEVPMGAVFDGQVREYRLNFGHGFSCYQDAWVRQLGLLLRAGPEASGAVEVQEIRLLRSPGGN
ncbi:MAG: hypothetical protein WEA09_04260 [Gemmatimonadota bacterium]